MDLDLPEVLLWFQVLEEWDNQQLFQAQLAHRQELMRQMASRILLEEWYQPKIQEVLAEISVLLKTTTTIQEEAE